MATYDPGIPSAGNKINAQFGQIQDNFDVLNDRFDRDHYNYQASPASLQGHHKVISAIQQTGFGGHAATTGKIFTQNNISPEATTRTDGYYAFDNDTLGNTLVAPLIPFKCMGAFNNTATSPIPAGQIFQGFNIGQITSSVAASVITFTITFLNPLANGLVGNAYPYIVLATGVNTLANELNAIAIESTLIGSFTLKCRTTGGAGPTRISFGVITL